MVLSDYGAVALLEQLSEDNLMLWQSPIALADAMVKTFFSDVAIKGLVSTDDMLQFTQQLPPLTPIVVHCPGLNGAIDLPETPDITIVNEGFLNA